MAWAAWALRSHQWPLTRVCVWFCVYLQPAVAACGDRGYSGALPPPHILLAGRQQQGLAHACAPTSLRTPLPCAPGQAGRLHHPHPLSGATTHA